MTSVFAPGTSQSYAYWSCGSGAGQGGGRPGEKGAGGVREAGEEGAGSSQGGGKREKKGKITQHCAIFRNRVNAKGREPKNTGREPRLKGTGSGRFKDYSFAKFCHCLV